jgi:hypothetical protein
MARKSLPVLFVATLSFFFGAGPGAAIMECSDCSCSHLCSTSCISSQGQWTSCGAQGLLCSGHPSCSGGCLTASEFELFSAALKEPRAPKVVDLEHGQVTARLTWRLGQHVEESGLGTLYAAGTALKLPKGRTQAPALAFFRGERAPGLPLPSGAPDLVVEMRSAPGHDRVVAEWLKAGTSAVLSVDTETRTVRVHRSLSDVRVLEAFETLELPDVVPGWSVLVDDLFR